MAVAAPITKPIASITPAPVRTAATKAAQSIGVVKTPPKPAPKPAPAPAPVEKPKSAVTPLPSPEKEILTPRIPESAPPQEMKPAVEPPAMKEKTARRRAAGGGKVGIRGTRRTFAGLEEATTSKRTLLG
jgi:hypothetical protein